MIFKILLILIPILIVGLVFLIKSIKIKKDTAKVAYVLEEYAGCTISGVVYRSYYNVSYEHNLYVEKILKKVNIEEYFINCLNHNCALNKSSIFCLEKKWINLKELDRIDKILNNEGYSKKQKFMFHTEKQKKCFLEKKPFNQFD